MISASAAAIRHGLEQSHWTATDLWRATLGVGGSFSTADVDGLVSGRLEASEIEHDILASALNDHFITDGNDHPVPYWSALRQGL